GQLNPLIRGWANYYRHGAAKRTFTRLDHHIFGQLWRWATRRHPTKPAHWKRRKYFSVTGKKWLFRVRLSKEQDHSRALTLYKAASTRIKRHIKIRGDANPYDPDYTRYFEMRRLHSRRWCLKQGNAPPPQRSGATRTVTHWLQFAAECPHQGAPV